MTKSIKNLRGTTGCNHYKKVAVKAEYSNIVGCSVNGCDNKGNSSVKISQCHVIKANQSGVTGKRYLVPMCTSHNQQYNVLLVTDARLKLLLMEDCYCGHL